MSIDNFSFILSFTIMNIVYSFTVVLVLKLKNGSFLTLSFNGVHSSSSCLFDGIQRFVALLGYQITGEHRPCASHALTTVDCNRLEGGGIIINLHHNYRILFTTDSVIHIVHIHVVFTLVCVFTVRWLLTVSAALHMSRNSLI